jgi:hypothetical protein
MQNKPVDTRNYMDTLLWVSEMWGIVHAYIKSMVLLSASENSIRSMPSPVYLREGIQELIEMIKMRLHQCKKARRLNMALN